MLEQYSNHSKATRFAAGQKEFIARLAAGCSQDGQNDVAKGVYFYRQHRPTEPMLGLYSPSVCVVAQGAKQAHIGDQKLRYDAAHFLVVSLDLPCISQVVEASEEKPYLCLKLEFDPSTIASVMVEAGLSPARGDTSVLSMAVSKLDAELLDAFVRFIRLLEDQDDFRVVSPMVMREIIYRLLKSEQGPRLQQMASFGGHKHRISKAVDILRNKFNEQIRIEDLARDLGMSVSSFHDHFKTATSMSPLQFQKVLRLQEARRLLLTGEYDAATAAAKVGYDDASQFSREYKRLFGAPPMRDVNRFKELSPA